MNQPFLLLQVALANGNLCYLRSPGAGLANEDVIERLSNANATMNKNLVSEGDSFVAVRRDRREKGSGRGVPAILLLGGIEPSKKSSVPYIARLNACFEECAADLSLASSNECTNVFDHAQLGRLLEKHFPELVVVGSNLTPRGGKLANPIRRIRGWLVLLCSVVLALCVLLVLSLKASRPPQFANKDEKPGSDLPISKADRVAELRETLGIPKSSEERFRDEIEKGGPVELIISDARIAQAKSKSLDPLCLFQLGNVPAELQDIVNSCNEANSPLDFKQCRMIRQYMYRWSLSIQVIRKATSEEIDGSKDATGPLLQWLMHIPRDRDLTGEPPVGPYFTERDARIAEILKKWLQSEYADTLKARYEIREGVWLETLAQLDKIAGPGDALNEVKNLEKRPAKLIKAWSDLFEGPFEDRVLGTNAHYPLPMKQRPERPRPNG